MDHKLLKSVLMVSSSMVLACGVAQAQETDPEPTFKGTEIVVTARKREEALIDVPLYVSTISQAQLDNASIENATDFIAKLPSISKSGDFLSPGKEFMMMVIRGVGANGGMEPAAPVFIDGVYMPRLGFDTNFMDVERVEVLYGPQSTLFGRNTEAGAINIVSRRPSAEFRGKVSFEWDEFETFKAKGALSGPIADGLYAGLSVEGMTTDGYLTNVGTSNVNSFGQSADPGAFFNASLDTANDPDSARSLAGRFALVWEPNDRLNAYLTLDTYSFKGGVGLPGVPKGCQCYDLDLDIVLDSEHKSEGAALNVEYSADNFDITSITAYRDLSSTSPFDFDGSSLSGLPEGVTPGDWATIIPGVTNTHRGNIQDYRFDQQVFSQELRVTSTTASPFQWIVGAYYYDEDFFSDRNIDIMGADQFPFFTRTQDVDAAREGWAVFGQASYDLTDQLQLSVGLRYSDEKATSFNTVDWETPAFPDFLNQRLGGEHTQEFKDNNLDYSASLRWSATEDLSLYFTTATAFKSGGFQLAITGDPVADAPYLSEQITSYEAGIKGDLLNGRLKTNLSIFYLELDDQQVRTIRTFNNLPFTITTNAAKATNKGFNLDFTFYPVDELQLSGAIGYIDAKFDEFVIADGNLDFSGEPLRFVPELTLNFGAEWTIPVNSKLVEDIALYGNWRYVDDQVQGYDGVSVDIEYDIEDYSLLDLGVRFGINSGTTATVFMNNVTDEYVETRHWNAFLFSNPGGEARSLSSVLAPRHVGIRFTHEF